jgi:aromatic-amino-acid transaminase
MLDDNEELITLPTMAKVYKEIDIKDIAAYAPISGIPEYLKAAEDLTFADCRPEGYISAVATAGGTGAIHHAIMNYAEVGEKVLTSDWFWGTYNVICVEQGKKLQNFKLFDENQNFNFTSFKENVEDIFKTQESLLIILNTPAHNPTGFALTENDWDNVLSLLKDFANKGKKATVLVDIAYIDYAGEKNEVRSFMKKFGNLPKNILGLFAFSMSKGYTFYGQRTGALVAVSSDKTVIDEFDAIMKYTSRATWSNINRGAMELLLRIQNDENIYNAFVKDREEVHKLIQARGDLFMKEAEDCNLTALPYTGGFFLSVPANDPQKVADLLHKDLIYAVPLKLGVRVAVCSVPLNKIKGMAEKINNALKI